LAEHMRCQLLRAPEGVVETDGTWFTRLLTPPLTVVAAVVRAATWRKAIQRAGRFTPFTQRLLVLDRLPSTMLTWEAQASGIGVWVVTTDGATHEVCQPEPFVRRYWRAAGWRFTEHAYAAALTSKRRSDGSLGAEGRPTRTGDAVLGPR
jgi:hypothetical protein